MNGVRITSYGHGDNTRVFSNGKEIEGVQSLSLKIKSGELMTAKLTVLVEKLDLEGKDFEIVPKEKGPKPLIVCPACGENNNVTRSICFECGHRRKGENES